MQISTNDNDCYHQRCDRQLAATRSNWTAREPQLSKGWGEGVACKLLSLLSNTNFCNCLVTM